MQCWLQVPHRVPSSPVAFAPLPRECQQGCSGKAPSPWLDSRATVRIPEPGPVGQQHVQVALEGVLIEGAAQPGPASADVRGDVVQGVEALQLVLAEHLLHVDPEHGLWGEKEQCVMKPASCCSRQL